MPPCRLCLKLNQLRKSHIIPEFLYEDLYDKNHKMIGIHGQGPKGREIVQKGLRELLLCDACEQHINGSFEKPFRKLWVESCPLPVQWHPDYKHQIRVEYATFKLFHLSVLFRAGISTLPEFEVVSLGPHETKLRQMLLNRDPGPETTYPIAGYAVLHHKTNKIVNFIARAEAGRIKGRRCYRLMYGGVHWWITVASDTPPALREMALREDGTMVLEGEPWNNIFIIQAASRALKSADA